MLLQLGLPSFDTVPHNAIIRFANNLHLLDNSVVSVCHAGCDMTAYMVKQEAQLTLTTGSTRL